MIESFGVKTRELIEKREKTIIIRFNEIHNSAVETISGLLSKIQSSKEFTKELNKETQNVLKKHFVSYYVKDNSDYVLSVLKKCIDEHLDCSTFMSFFTSLAQAEMYNTARAMKECLLIYSTNKITKTTVCYCFLFNR